MNEYDNIPELSDSDSDFLDSIIEKITKKYIAQGGKEANIKSDYMDYILTMMFYCEGRQAVLHYARDYTYNPAQRVQPVYIERYADGNFPEIKPAKAHTKTVRHHVRGTDKKQRNTFGNQNQRRRQIYCDGTIYNTMAECAKAYGVHASNMCAWLKGDTTMPSRFADMGLRYADRA